MIVMADANSFRLDFDGCVEEFGRHRRAHPEVLHQLLGSGLFGADTRVLDVGCGTGNYAAALTEAMNTADYRGRIQSLTKLLMVVVWYVVRRGA